MKTHLKAISLLILYVITFIFLPIGLYTICLHWWMPLPVSENSIIVNAVGYWLLGFIIIFISFIMYGAYKEVYNSVK